MAISMSAARDLMERTGGVWYVEVDLDYCTLENGVPPCTATTPCYFTRLTCQDVANYSLGTKTYKFCSRGGRVSGALPLLREGVTWLPTKIDSARYTVEKGEMRFTLRNDDPQELADPTKSTSQEENHALPGRFLDRWLARNPNTKGRVVRLYRGVESVSISTPPL